MVSVGTETSFADLGRVRGCLAGLEAHKPLLLSEGKSRDRQPG